MRDRRDRGCRSFPAKRIFIESTRHPLSLLSLSVFMQVNAVLLGCRAVGFVVVFGADRTPCQTVGRLGMCGSTSRIGLENFGNPGPLGRRRSIPTARTSEWFSNRAVNVWLLHACCGALHARR